jgi:hypothetical protein
VSEARAPRPTAPARPARRDPLLWAAPGLLLAALLVLLAMFWLGSTTNRRAGSDAIQTRPGDGAAAAPSGSRSSR